MSSPEHDYRIVKKHDRGRVYYAAVCDFAAKPHHEYGYPQAFICSLSGWNNARRAECQAWIDAQAAPLLHLEAEYQDGTPGYAVCDAEHRLVKWFPVDEVEDARVLVADYQLASRLRAAEQADEGSAEAAYALNDVCARLDLPADQTEQGLTEWASDRVDAFVEDLLGPAGATPLEAAYALGRGCGGLDAAGVKRLVELSRENEKKVRT